MLQVVGMHEKLPRLMQILRSKPHGTKFIIFCSTKRMCDQLSGQLREFHASAIHGDKRQQVIISIPLLAFPVLASLLGWVQRHQKGFRWPASVMSLSSW